ncbi:pyridoxamine-phosphate oxidase [Neophaeococcomyces mojaviensis]|uniref:Pyridoxamine-phosphate oxidase n=1 Tax=Neophaeococcomyces mojaviensis TaxID=3383035 RepID=A0ACC2ZY15_9EURO|nr:pyridoxamine-phosphate oxidase [Knufia sp. JES_112]
MATVNASSKAIAPGEAPPDSAQPLRDAKGQQAAQFSVGKLTRPDLDPDPFKQFHKWFSEPALKGSVPETVTLSTAELPSGRVSSRMVYLKELDERGWVIYSNWGTSRKAKDVESNPYASLCFWWKPLERQVRVEGPCERLSSEESQVYYDTRARGSRIGAWASQQSSVLRPSGDGADDGRAMLEQQVLDIEKRFDGTDQIPVPDFWGGLRVRPEMVEFWQGRDSRLHDRFKYTRDSEDGPWRIERLSP